MRGTDGMQEALFTVAKLEDFVPADHPLRPIRLLVNEALAQLNGLFNDIYADSGRARIAPEKLLRAMLIQVFFLVRSERQLMPSAETRYSGCRGATPAPTSRSRAYLGVRTPGIRKPTTSAPQA